ncbi:MAG: RNA polymerase sigma factor, partial [Bryobacterales bacterium]|nr:RNA polymerase sigma factor [Bryobacterales bacterium]
MSDQGKPATFHGIYEKYARDLYGYLYYLCGSRDLAEDLTSETFLRVWASPIPVEMPTVKAYLFTIGRRLFLTEAKRRGRVSELTDGLAVEEAGAEHRVQLEQVRRSLAELPELERSALLMRAEQGLSYDEIGAALAIPAATARVKVHRAR